MSSSVQTYTVDINYINQNMTCLHIVQKEYIYRLRNFFLIYFQFLRIYHFYVFR